MPTLSRAAPRTLARTLATALAFAALISACGGGAPPAGCPPCPSGQQCVAGVCQTQALPCGGKCTQDQACSDAGQCVPAQGATCPSTGCPAGYPCNGTTCALICTLNSDCARGFVCNPATNSCTQCVFNSDCSGVAGKPTCDSKKGICAQCTAAIDCSSLGPAHYCAPATDTCQAGCLVDGDCSESAGEHCDGASGTTPGRCIQCKTSASIGRTNAGCLISGVESP